MSTQRNDNIINNLKMENERLKKELEEVRNEQIEYLQNVSHQLVAPLNAIKWHIENLTEGRYHNIERINKVLRSIYSQATISVHLAKNFALMSNLAADHKLSQLRERPESVHLCRLMVNLADDFQPLAWDKDIRIIVINDPLDKAPEVMLIKNLISQVFSNIIENAIKYSRSGSKTLIDGSYDLDNKSVTVNVSSEGLPLPDGDINQIFIRGFRSEAACNLYPAGTGFGLFIAKKIVGIHDGKILA
ncbi:unnamed protein product, partial [marine sediment metagenome]